ncbi:hypothetical protein ACZ87_02192, partial [Candidatus Erwinia dacicola]
MQYEIPFNPLALTAAAIYALSRVQWPLPLPLYAGQRLAA